MLYEIATREDPAAKEIGIELGLDPGYLSRIVQSFDDSGLITRKPLPSDRRQYQLGLTAKGRQAFDKLDRSSHDDVAAIARGLPDGGRERLIGAMAVIESLLGASGAHFRLRSCGGHRPGDMGWVVQSHGSPMPANMAWIPRSKAWLRKYREISRLVRRVTGALLDRRTRRRPGRLGISGHGTATMSPNCGCCWWIRPGVARDLAGGWSPNA